MKFINHILILSALTLGACSESLSEPQVTPAACTINLVLRDGGMQRSGADDGSDGTWGSDYDQSYYFESESVIDNIQFFVRTPDGTIEPLQARLVTVGSTIRTYSARIAVGQAGVVSRDGMLYFSGRIIGITNFPDKIDSPFDNNPFATDRIRTSGGLIPMWGVAQLEALGLRENEVVLAGDIYMLRAVPRISFVMHDDVKSLYHIKSIVPDQTDYPAIANVFPTGGQSVSNTIDLFLEGCFNPSESAETAAPHFYYTEDHTTWWTYVAERNCGLVGDRPLGFNVTLEETAEPHRTFSGKIYLCDYAGGQPDFNSPYDKLVRNHDYKFIINLSALDFQISVEKWIPGGRYNIDFDL